MKDEEVDRYHIAAYISGLDLRRVLKDDDLFVVVNRAGNIRSLGRGEQGLYYKGTKHVSQLLLRLGGQAPLLPGSGVQQDDLLLAVDQTKPDLCGHDGDPKEHARAGALAIPYGTVHVGRSSFPRAGAYYERIVISNFGLEPLSLTV